METLAIVSAGVIAFAILMYVVLDGFDLGIGILFPFAPDEDARHAMINSVAPVWDGNETWLVLGGGGLLVFFPTAYSIVLPAFYIPVMAMLFALIFRGVTFEFRHSAHTSVHLWNRSFFYGSLVAAFMQGVLLGALVQGVNVEGVRYAGGMFDWLTPFSILTGIGVVAGYGLLGATWTIYKTAGKVQDWARGAAVVLGGGTLVAMTAVSVMTPLLRPAIAERWFGGLNLLYLSPVPFLTLALAIFLFWSIFTKRELAPFLSSVGLFILGFFGIAVSLYPNIIPPSVTVWDVVAPRSSIVFALIGVAVVLPMVLLYTVYAYSVFHGKASEHGGYAEHD
ncbi:cytochrome d ubiquinol oxidase subunit II [Parvibaculum sp.]|uniref:cytochrome d ubiquinol oxidase subunit II n=1 Tax=Parvibaculum sp. TaxID=2024848 RepID=UPI0027312B3C|nr:cytochrome d ubiquinol oxidase subunit II [Parvibaculum sp.]MDP1626656.1 cytochrome d ubiquinol oxidase subunit II [Parvibaculum sp.]MDP2150577.1 cytochrome d ubiquinol oxidase subunit II [Parvibaculum sp.]MDP3330045.1 cytochrome d ubiquinol oxidase subunit II [Parvibaculum sp.]